MELFSIRIQRTFQLVSTVHNNSQVANQNYTCFGWELELVPQLPRQITTSNKGQINWNYRELL